MTDTNNIPGNCMVKTCSLSGEESMQITQWKLIPTNKYHSKLVHYWFEKKGKKSFEKSLKIGHQNYINDIWHDKWLWMI